MKLIIGGAHQGKRDYALKHYAPKATVSRCTETEPEIDFSGEIIDSLHLAILAQLRSGIDPIDYFEKHLEDLASKIVICDDISNGVVPIEKEMRQWREAVGRTLILLSENAEEVIRVFCGLGTKLK